MPYKQLDYIIAWMNTYTAGWLAAPFDDIKNGDQETSVYFSIRGLDLTLQIP